MLEWRAAVSALCVALSCGGVAWAAAHPTHAWQAAPVAAAPRVAQQQLGRWPGPRLRHTNRVGPITVPEARRAALSPAALSHFPSLPLATRSPWLTLLAPLVAAGMWLAAFLRGRRGERPAVFAVPGTKVARWLDACDTLTEGFTPTWWCTNPHWQTIVGAFIRGKPKVPYHRELLGINSNGTVALDWTENPATVLKAAQHGVPIVLLLHGVTGGSQEAYVGHLAESIHNRGWLAVVLNQRGCGDSALTSPKAYCGAASDDCADVVAHLSRAYPRCPLFAVGFSLGANILTKYLGEAWEKAPLDAAVAVGNPFDMLRCGRLLERGINRLLYSIPIAHKLKAYLHRHKDALAPVMDAARADSVTTTWEFDDAFTAPAFGFKSAEDYYRQASSLGRLGTVAVPLLCINADDDPIAPGDLDYAAGASGSVALVSTHKGGHLGWLEGWWPSGVNWADRLVIQYLEAAAGSAAAAETVGPADLDPVAVPGGPAHDALTAPEGSAPHTDDPADPSAVVWYTFRYG